jgi:hypothetical protein
MHEEIKNGLEAENIGLPFSSEYTYFFSAKNITKNTEA